MGIAAEAWTELRHPGRVGDRPWCNTVHADPVGTPLQRQRPVCERIST